MMFAPHPLLAILLAGVGFSLIFLLPFPQYSQPKSPAIWKLKPLNHPQYHALFEIEGYVIGWTDRWKLGGEFAHVGFAERPGSCYFRPFFRLAKRKIIVSMVGMRSYDAGYSRQLHIREIPLQLKTCKQRVRITGYILKNLGTLSYWEFNDANRGECWGEDQHCPFVQVDLVELLEVGPSRKPNLVGRARAFLSGLVVAWHTMPF